MQKLVLLVDDDKLPMHYYITALKQKAFKVEHCLEPDSALSFAKKRGEEVDVIILDIMLPPGKIYKNKNTNEGLKTGVFLLEDLRKYCPNTPIVILTNVINPKTLSEFKNKHLVKLAQKMDYPPFELSELVDDMAKRKKTNSISDESRLANQRE